MKPLILIALLASCQITTNRFEIGAHLASDEIGYAGIRHEFTPLYIDAGLGVTPLTDQPEDDHRSAWFIGAGWLYPLGSRTRCDETSHASAPARPRAHAASSRCPRCGLAPVLWQSSTTTSRSRSDGVEVWASMGSLGICKV